VGSGCFHPDPTSRNCRKHVEFYSKNKYEKLMHLVGFITRIYHNALSSGCQTGHSIRIPKRSLCNPSQLKCNRMRLYKFIMAFTSDYELYRDITGQWRISHRISSRVCLRTKYTSGFLCMKNKTPETEPVYQSPFLEGNNYKL
jgi:hypothetical protein